MRLGRSTGPSPGNPEGIRPEYRNNAVHFYKRTANWQSVIEDASLRPGEREKKVGRNQLI
jgi:hypothetical protein